MKKILILVVAAFLFAYPAFAEIVEERIDYEHGGEDLRGYLYYDKTAADKKPLVLVIHEWWGLNDYAKNRAWQLAGLGYVAFAADMYGGGKKTEHSAKAREWMQTVTQNKEHWRARAQAALDVVKNHPAVDGEKTAAIGYCFGGATVMQMAYSGADLDAVVSFHGSLIAPDAAENIQTAILVHNGAADTFIGDDKIDAWQNAMKNSAADWVFVNHANARHGFTNPDAGAFGAANGIDNLAYQQKADRRSWRSMHDFLAEHFRD